MDLSILEDFLRFLSSLWWIIIPPILLIALFDTWLFYRQVRYKNTIKWKLLELRVPKEVLQTPKAMEQVFAAVHAIYTTGISFWEMWWDGKVENWASFEFVGRAGNFHFYIRIPENYKNLVESAIYAQYPDAEISEVDDYVNEFPPRLPDHSYDLWGGDWILAKEDAYPIQTYPHFEEVTEERRLDPISTITEVMSKLKDTEAIWLQILVRYASDKWKTKAEALINKLLGREKKPSRGVIQSMVDETPVFLRNLAFAPFEHPTWGEGEKPKEEKGKDLRGGERKVIERMEEKLTKLAFESVLRFIYIDKRDSFTRSNIAAMMGALRQFNAPLMNSFRPNLKTLTYARFPFKKKKVQRKKRLLFDNYRIRHFSKKFSILNIEELATIYHFPITGVKSPVLRRVQSRRGSPPSGLPTA